MVLRQRRKGLPGSCDTESHFADTESHFIADTESHFIADTRPNSMADFIAFSD